MSMENILGDSRPASEAGPGQMIEVEGLRMRVMRIAEDQTRVCRDIMADIWRIPAGTRCLIVEPK